MRKVGIIHTTVLTIAPLKQLIIDTIDNVEVYNILDDTILPDMIHSNDVNLVKKRWIEYAATFEQKGFDVVLSACSTVGEFADLADEILNIKVLRIDEKMNNIACENYQNIAVLATLNSTLTPTINLINRLSKKNNKLVNVKGYLIDGAFAAATSGNKALHNSLILKQVMDIIDNYDVLVFAQASMANAISTDVDTSKILTSPALGITHLKEVLG